MGLKELFSKHDEDRDEIKESVPGAVDLPGQRVRGTVAWFDDHKGWGFIRPEKGPSQRDVFLHFSHLSDEFKDEQGRRSVPDGTPVEFSIMQNSKGPYAVEVRRAYD